MKTKGFTLIELLIVVAIIAILVAIAIPNLMHAQTRAKVSRARGDMHSIALALESYNIDQNVYPGCLEGYPGVAIESFLPDSITTPIPYLKSDAFVDPFHDIESGGYGVRYRYFEWESFCRNPLRKQDYENTYGSWNLISYGPDRVIGPLDYCTTKNGTSGWMVCPYDPTNGSASWGDVMRSQKHEIELCKPE